MRMAIVVSVGLLAPTVAYAGKPSEAQAKKAAAAWIAGLGLADRAPDAKALGAVTITPFVSAADNDDQVPCPVTTTTSADKLGDVYECIGGVLDEPIGKAKLKPYKKGDLGSQYDDHVKPIAAIKDARLVRAGTPCAGTEQTVVLAVVSDHGAAKVAGVFALNETCGE
jgi:hypothetical protein